MIEILDFCGTVMVLIAAFTFATKKASNPKIRIKAFLFFLGSNFVWIPMGIMLEIYWFLLTQIILLGINIKGIIVCKKEMKEECVVL